MDLPPEFWVSAYQRTRNEDAIASAVGHVVIAFNRLERQVGECLALLLGAKHPSTKTVLNAALGLRRGSTCWPPCFLKPRVRITEIALLNYCVRTLTRLEDERNRIVHSTYGLGAEEDTKFVRKKENVKGGKGLRVSIQPADVSAMLLFVERMGLFGRLEWASCTGSATVGRLNGARQWARSCTGASPTRTKRSDTQNIGSSSKSQRAEGHHADA